MSPGPSVVKRRPEGRLGLLGRQRRADDLNIEVGGAADQALDVRRRGRRQAGSPALAPIREELGPERLERLVSALAMVIGFEARMVARDVRGLDVEAGAAASRWAAAALVRAALDESRAGAPNP